MAALLPLRHARMATNAFSFYRGSALVMAADLDTLPRSGLEARLSGDAHLSNFGLYAAADRRIVFDLNDVDEAATGPIEWDLQRLSTSCVLAAHAAGKSAPVGIAAARAAAAAYRQSMRERAARTEIEVWYGREDAKALDRWMARDDVGSQTRRELAASRASAAKESMWTAVESLTTKTTSGRRFVDKPPLLVRIGLSGDLAHAVLALFESYRAGSGPALREVLARYRVIDVAHKVVGVGSVGIMDFVLLLQGRSGADLLVLQMKNAQPSVLAAYTAADPTPPAERVVTSARLIQPSTDPFLGTAAAGATSFYVRQLRDMKWAPDPSRFTSAGLVDYARVCGHDLARSHARTGDAVAIATYLGGSTAADQALADFAVRYAKQVRRDAAAFAAAATNGTMSSSSTVRRADIVAGLHEALGLT